MIVQCDQCKTRFRIPDEKVTEKGVKVRCTKCQHTFRVKKGESLVAPPVPPVALPVPPPSAQDPFAIFGPAPQVAAPSTPPPAEGNSSLLADVPEAADFSGESSGATPASTAFDDVPMEPGLDVSGNRDQLFDMPAPRKEVIGEVPSGAQESRRPSGEHVAVMPLKVGSLIKPAGSVAHVGVPQSLTQRQDTGGTRRLTALVVNVVVAAVLLLMVGAVGWAFLNEGKLDPASLSLERARSFFLSPQGVVALDVSNGLYDTRAGRPVFFVRGEVENRSGRAGKIKVRAEILDGVQLVRAVEGHAGVAPTPEELFDIASAADVETLHQRLTEKAVEVAPGARSPFLLTFYEYPPNLPAFRVKVTVEHAKAGQTAAR
ncbi:MAG: zinc-ribbon domain-containing protein [Myxococcota bacterium]